MWKGESILSAMMVESYKVPVWNRGVEEILKTLGTEQYQVFDYVSLMRGFSRDETCSSNFQLF